MVNSQVRNNKLFKRLNFNYSNFSLKLGFINDVKYIVQEQFSFSYFNVIHIAKNVLKKRRKSITEVLFVSKVT